MVDDVPEAIKKRRLQEIVDLQQKLSEKRTKRFMGETVEVLIEKESKKSNQHWSGRNSENVVTVFPKGDYKVGDFVMVKISDCTTATLIGEAVGFSEMN
jgi:tRNA-2-methylthio-N6-dimethylallyladenosine synthase